MTPAQLEFLRRVKAAARVSESKGVPASVMVAQSVVESGWGRSGLARLGNALFGVKARSSWPGSVYSGTTYEVVNGRSVKFPGKNRVYPSYAAAIADGCNPVALFRAYPSFEESIADHADFFHRNPRYHPCLDAYAQTKDPFAFAACIHKAGYATSLTYTETLHGAMRLYASDLLPEVAAGPAPAQITVTLDGVSLPADHVTTLEGRVFLHVRVLEQLGKSVRWNPTTRTVEVT